MTGTALLDVQQAIFTALDGNLTNLSAANVPVYDFVPDNTPFDYVTIGDDNEVPFDNFGPRHGKEVESDIQVWTRYEGFRQAKHIANQIIQLLDNVSLTVSGHVHHYTEHIATIDRIEDGETRRIIVRFITMVSEV